MNEFDNGTMEANSESVSHELESLQRQWWCLALLGLILVAFGVGAIVYPFQSTVGIAIALGAVLLVSGIVTIVAAFWAAKWSAFLLQSMTTGKAGSLRKAPKRGHVGGVN